MRNTLLPLLLLLSWAATLSAQEQKATFDLTRDGQNVGTAEYSITPSKSGHTLKSKFHCKAEISKATSLPSEISGSTTASFDPDWQVDRIAITGSEAIEHMRSKGFVSQAPKTVSIQANKERNQLQFNIGGIDLRTGKLATASIGSAVMDPHTVVFIKPSYIRGIIDPGYIQVLLNMAKSNPSADGDYHILRLNSLFTNTIGTSLLTTRLTSPTSESGTLDGQSIPVKRSTLFLGSLQMDVCTDSDGNLLQAGIPSQQIAATRKGFTMQKNTTAPAASSSAPAPDVK